MAVIDTGESVGSFTGGCLEGVVVEQARRTMAERRNTLIRYGKGSPFFDVTLPCGSGLDIFFDQTVCGDDVRRVLGHVELRRPSHLCLDLMRAARLPADLPVPTMHRRNYLPSTRIAIAGDCEAAGLLARLADVSGLGVVEMNTFGPRQVEDICDAWTAVAVLFHDHEKEDAFLEAALRTDCFYIGALGSHKAQAARRARLFKGDIDTEAWARIRQPIGLIPGAKSPRELAVSTLAEITDAARGLK